MDHSAFLQQLLTFIKMYLLIDLLILEHSFGPLKKSCKDFVHVSNLCVFACNTSHNIRAKRRCPYTCSLLMEVTNSLVCRDGANGHMSQIRLSFTLWCHLHPDVSTISVHLFILVTLIDQCFRMLFGVKGHIYLKLTVTNCRGSYF